MSLFECKICGCIENTAVSSRGFKHYHRFFDWEGIEDRKGKMICSECGPEKYKDGEPTEYGNWHGRFDKKLAAGSGYWLGEDGFLYRPELYESGHPNHTKLIRAI